MLQEEEEEEWDYEKIKGLIEREGITMPCGIVHKEVFISNFTKLWEIAIRNGKKLRIATKSVRVLGLVRLLLDVIVNSANHQYIINNNDDEESKNMKGKSLLLMAYTVGEAKFLFESLSEYGKYRNHELDVLVAYPTVQMGDILTAYEMIKKGGKNMKFTVMIDCVDHVNIIDSVIHKLYLRDNNNNDLQGREFKIRVCVDVDVSYELLNGYIHLGPHRSPIRNADQFRNVLNAVMKSRHLRFVGVMTYDAQIAGLPDLNPYVSSLMNFVISCFKRVSAIDVRRRRKEIYDILTKEFQFDPNKDVEIFNGGGTGSFEECCKDEYVNEVSAGSGFLQGTLFDYYKSNICNPALIICLPVSRSFDPNGGIMCAQSGGFIASGATSKDKSPTIFLPSNGIQVFEDEGFGEVQTPFYYNASTSTNNTNNNNNNNNKNIDTKIKLGDPLVLRSAKSGEIAERFNHYTLVSTTKSNLNIDYVVVERYMKTYRGDGQCFL